MVCGNHINGSIQQARQQRLPVLFPPNGRIHFKAAVLLEHFVVLQQVMRSRLAGDVQALLLGLTDEFHSLFGGNVTHMVSAAGFLHQAQIPRHRPPLTF